MSTIKEMAKSKTTIMVKPKENIIQSIFKDLVTFSMIAFCIYLSQGSTWWTFVTGSMFLVYGLGKIGRSIKNSATTFKTVKEAKEYLDKLKSMIEPIPRTVILEYSVQKPRRTKNKEKIMKNNNEVR